jgi:hypothetical protein
LVPGSAATTLATVKRLKSNPLVWSSATTYKLLWLINNYQRKLLGYLNNMPNLRKEESSSGEACHIGIWTLIARLWGNLRSWSMFLPDMNMHFDVERSKSRV